MYNSFRGGGGLIHGVISRAAEDGAGH